MVSATTGRASARARRRPRPERAGAGVARCRGPPAPRAPPIPPHRGALNRPHPRQTHLFRQGRRRRLLLLFRRRGGRVVAAAGRRLGGSDIVLDDGRVGRFVGGGRVGGGAGRLVGRAWRRAAPRARRLACGTGGGLGWHGGGGWGWGPRAGAQRSEGEWRARGVSALTVRCASLFTRRAHGRRRRHRIGAWGGGGGVRRARAGERPAPPSLSPPLPRSLYPLDLDPPARGSPTVRVVHDKTLCTQGGGQPGRRTTHGIPRAATKLRSVKVIIAGHQPARPRAPEDRERGGGRRKPDANRPVEKKQEASARE